MRIPLLFALVFAGIACPGRAQVPDPGMAAQDPGMAQDAEAARQKIFKAADQLDLIESNSEANKVAIDAMKADIARLQADNADLKRQVAAVQAALDKADADRAKERQALLDEVASLIASKTGESAHAAKHHMVLGDETDGASPPVSTEVHAAGADEADVSHPHHKASTEDVADADTGSGDSTPAPAPAPKPQKGYYHVVESGETLSMICAAYREQGVKVTTAQVRKANGLSSKSVLKVGQKLFIPKPGA